jgi:hypothetical protein
MGKRNNVEWEGIKEWADKSDEKEGRHGNKRIRRWGKEVP